MHRASEYSQAPSSLSSTSRVDSGGVESWDGVPEVTRNGIQINPCWRAQPFSYSDHYVCGSWNYPRWKDIDIGRGYHSTYLVNHFLKFDQSDMMIYCDMTSTRRHSYSWFGDTFPIGQIMKYIWIDIGDSSFGVERLRVSLALVNCFFWNKKYFLNHKINNQSHNFWIKLN